MLTQKQEKSLYLIIFKIESNTPITDDVPNGFRYFHGIANSTQFVVIERYIDFDFSDILNLFNNASLSRQFSSYQSGGNTVYTLNLTFNLTDTTFVAGQVIQLDPDISITDVSVVSKIVSTPVPTPAAVQAVTCNWCGTSCVKYPLSEGTRCLAVVPDANLQCVQADNECKVLTSAAPVQLVQTKEQVSNVQEVIATTSKATELSTTGAVATHADKIVQFSSLSFIQDSLLLFIMSLVSLITGFVTLFEK